MIKLLGEHIAFSKFHSSARAPFFLKRSDGEILLGMNIYWGGKKLSHDWNLGQRPYVISGRTIEELLHCEPRGIGQEHGLPPAFIELEDGSLLAAFNRWKEVDLGTPEAEAALKDERITVRTHLDDEIALKGGQRDSVQARANALGLDFAEKVHTLGILQPIRIMRSTDGGWTWDSWSAISSDPTFPRETSFRGNFVRVKNELLFSLNYQNGPGDARISYLMSSVDQGKTWQKKGVIAADPANKNSFTETFLHLSPDGELIALVRNSTHCIAVVRSLDLGATWSKPHITGIMGYPCDVLMHSTGRALVTYGLRKPPMGVISRVTKPDLSDIEEVAATYVDKYPFVSSLGGGYPSSVELEDGTVLVAYFCRRTNWGPTQIVIRHIELQ